MTIIKNLGFSALFWLNPWSLEQTEIGTILTIGPYCLLGNYKKHLKEEIETKSTCEWTKWELNHYLPTWTISEVLDADAMVEVPEGLEEPENVEIVFIKAHSHSVMDVSSSYDKSRWRQNVSILLSCSHLTLCVTIEKLWIKIV